MLSPAEAAVIRVSAALASRSTEEVQRSFETAVGPADPVQVEETVLQSYLFLGYPAALNGFATWRLVSGHEAPSAPDAANPEVWAERGARVCRVVYGGQYERLRSNIRARHPDMDRWMIVEGYGKVLGRPGMALELRELCIVALLAVQDLPTQLFSHLRGALNAGATPRRVEAALAIARHLSEPEAARRALQVWARVESRSAEG